MELTTRAEQQVACLLRTQAAGLLSPLPGVTYSLGESHADAVVVGTGAELNGYNVLTPAFLSDMS